MERCALSMSRDQGYGSVTENSPRNICPDSDKSHISEIPLQERAREQIEHTLHKNPWAIKHIEEKSLDQQLVQIALLADGATLGLIPKSFLNLENMLCAVDSNGNALKDVPKDHSEYALLAKRAVAQTGWAIRFVPDELIDSDLLISALNTTPQCVILALEGRSKDQLSPELVEKAIHINPLCYSKLPEEYQTAENRALAEQGRVNYLRC